jgi:putative ABC transport system permease protein
MPWQARLRSLRRNLLHRARAERELDEEARSLLELLADEKVRSGLSPDAARRAAAIELGGLEPLKARVRGERAGAWLDGLGQDVRHGARMLRRNPGLAAIGVLTLALGIGANTAIFSVVSAVLLRPLPYPQADRLVLIWTTEPSRGAPISPTAAPDFREWRRQARGFAEMGAYALADLNLGGDAGGAAGQEPERVQAARVSASLFPTLGVRPARGRLFLPEEERFGSHREVLLSDGLWHRRFGGRPQMVGGSISLDGESYTVVGVMPQGMPFFDNVPAVDLWVPLAFARDDNFNTRDNRFLTVVGRLGPGTRLEQAQSEISLIAGRIERQDIANAGYGALVMPLREQVVGRVRAVLLVLFGAVGCVLLIACANLANLLLARAAARARELAVRASLGASRRRLVRQLLVENLPLGLAGGAAGIALAWWAERLLVSLLLPASFPRFNAIAIDGRALAFTLAVSLLTIAAFGLAPALAAARQGLRDALGEGGRAMSQGVRRRRLRGALVVAETALTLVLLLGAGLLARSFALLRRLDPGFSAARVLTVQVPLPESSYPLPTPGRPSPDRAMAFFDRLVERVRALPGVQAAGVGSQLPLGAGPGWGKYFYAVDRPLPASLAAVPVVLFKLADPGFLRALGYQPRAGRLFTAADGPRSLPVAIVNEAFARRYFPGEDPVGRRLVMDAPAHLLPPPWDPRAVPAPRRTIVGVVADVKNARMGVEAQPEVYAPVAQNVGEGWINAMTLVVRAAGAPASLLPAVRAQVRALDAGQPVTAVATMEEHLQRWLSQPRFGMLLLSLFAGAALLLALVGVYGVVAYEARQRTHEIGIRTAIGARPGHILRLIVGDGLKLALLGAALGAAAALPLVRLLASQLYGVGRYDPVTFGVMPALLVAAAGLAAYLPARRATQVDPVTALRHE